MFKAKIILICMVCFIGLTGKTDSYIKSNWEGTDPLKVEKFISAEYLEGQPARLAQLKAQIELEAKQEAENRQALAGKKKELISCLNKKGISLFTSSDPSCEACKLQAEYLGDALKDLKKQVKCNEEAFVCGLRSIKTYPTWHLGFQLGTKITGVKTPEELAKITNCPF